MGQAAAAARMLTKSGPESAMEFTRITIDPKRMGGVPIIRQLRIPVATVVDMVADGTVVHRRIVVLHQFVKKSPHTPRRELDIARRRMKDVRHG